MVEESARVVKIDGDVVWVEAIRQSACESCSAQKGCGHSLLAKVSQKSIEVPVERNGLSLNINDQVIIGVPEQAILRSSLLVYGVPLFAMILLAATVSLLSGSEGLTALASLLGLLGGFAFVSWKSNHLNVAQWHPKIIKIIRAEQSAIPVCHL